MNRFSPRRRRSRDSFQANALIGRRRYGDERKRCRERATRRADASYLHTHRRRNGRHDRFHDLRVHPRRRARHRVRAEGSQASLLRRPRRGASPATSMRRK
eukprot:30598-Pelagococcus_subviridis.AAC.3